MRRMTEDDDRDIPWGRVWCLQLLRVVVVVVLFVVDVESGLVFSMGANDSVNTVSIVC